MKKCFILIVDGKEYGPFWDKYKKECPKLAHLFGIEIKTVFLKTGWVVFIPPNPRVKKDKTHPLLDDIGFTPMPKNKQW